ncbi:MAG: TonB-dependent receptor plug domain-containing protein [Rhodospirillaceae bacterium]
MSLSGPANHRRTPFLKRHALTTVSAASLVLGGAITGFGAKAAYAQAEQEGFEEIIVTGTRIVRDGFEAPTPVTVMNVEQIESAARPNIADMVNMLPAFAGGTTPHSGGADVSSGRQGQNNLNLRGLGVNRTLTLLDGHRIVSGDTNGAINVNDFPQQLISRVDVVTGGASAAYGSDAVSGVVNFILDKTYTGIKGAIEGGVTTYGDDRTYKGNLTFGTPFAAGRGHFLISGEYSKVEGLLGTPRDWNKEGWRRIQNPAYGTAAGQSTSVPQFLVLDRVGASVATLGGIIVSGPLKGIHFGPNGEPLTFNYGPIVSNPFMQGGDWRYSDASQDGALDNPVMRQSLFTRVSYGVTESVEVYAQHTYGWSTAYGQATTMFDLGSRVIRADNAFIPASVRQRMTELGLTSFTMGTLNPDLPHLSTWNKRLMHSYAVGATGSFDGGGSTWNWDLYGQRGISRSMLSAEAFVASRLADAVDSIRGPNGQIICRSQLAAPGNGCVPYNSFGIGVNSAAAVDYAVDNSTLYQRSTETIFSAALTGEPFALPAGPVSLAVGVDYRKPGVSGVSDAMSQARGYLAGNFQGTRGSYDVWEGYAETVVPLAKDASWAEALDLNGAVRATDYSTSGFVVTWKVGATYTPVSDIRLRATRSRDIRAPNLFDAFLAGSGSSTPNLRDPATNLQIPTVLTNTVGNPNLGPEKADTLGLGLVYQPSWLEGFSAAFDYYDISIKDAIATIGNQATLDRCFLGNQAFCANIARNAQGVITIVTVAPINFVLEKTNGYDIEASYTTPLDRFVSDWNGSVTLRALGTHVLKLTRDDGVAVPTDSAGSNAGNGPPDWRWLLSATYDNDPLNINLTARIISDGTYDNSFVECTTGCPVSTVTNRTINNNHIDGYFYLDAAITYVLPELASGTEIETFLSIQNIMNKDPAMVANNNHYGQASNPNLYDTLGRQFRVGLRFRR